MHNLQLNFTYPWVLLLIIPAVIMTLWPYFKLSKRHRRTRNRIISIILHLTVMVLSILAFSGLTFSYQVPNQENEIILLVDVSDSSEEGSARRDEFVDLVLQDSQYDGYRVGIVTFGYDQVYAVPLTYEVTEIYEEYLAARLPDTTATNIADALNYARDLFTNKQSAKIVLITDGLETDKDALMVVRSIAAQGIKVDTALITNEAEEAEAQISSVELPEYHMTIGEEYPLSVQVQSKLECEATIELYDNGELVVSQSESLFRGSKPVAIPITFEKDGMHELMVKLNITADSYDSLTENNLYYTYHYVESFNKILLLQREEGESDALIGMINAENKYVVDLKTMNDSTLPTTVAALCEYDQVILNNVANSDMPEGFIDLLYTYVNDCGGGMFTVGGDRKEGEESVANIYNRKDMYNTLYQQMLPVEVINYTPPLGVMVLMDISGSMAESANGASKLDWAKAGVEACLDALSVRDYIGVMTFDNYADTILELTPRTQEGKIKAKLNEIKEKNAGGGTVVDDALSVAAAQLDALKTIDKRHIIIVTDGVIAGADAVKAMAKKLYDTKDITISVVGIGIKDDSTKQSMQELVDLADGRVIIENPGDKLIDAMREELNVDPLKEVEHKAFNPRIASALSPLVRGLTNLTLEDGTTDRNKLAISLDGFYGVKARSTAELILTGNHEVPIYAQWKFGEGMVGSFMCDLNGKFTKTFMTDPEGKVFVQRVIDNLMPTKNIRPNDISVELKEDNYTNSISVYLRDSLKEDESLKAEIYDSNNQLVLSLNELTTPDEETGFTNQDYYVTATMNAVNSYSRADFVIKKSGVYKIVVTRYKGETAVGSFTTHKSLTYSEEYDLFQEKVKDGMTLEERLEEIAKRGGGSKIEDLQNAYEIFEGFTTDLDKTFDPRWLFMITSIVLFLLDIAVRKFKFKWPHELIREYREKKNQLQ